MRQAPLSEKAITTLLDSLAQQEAYAFFETTKITDDEHLSWLFKEPVDHLRCTANDTPESFLNKAQEALDKGFYLAGWFSYEFGYLLEPVLARALNFSPDTILAELGVFPTPHVYNHDTNTFNQVGPWPSSEIKTGEASKGYSIDNLSLSETRSDYLEKIGLIKAFIEAGDTYQINYTLKYVFDFHGSTESLYQALRRSQSVSYAALIRHGNNRILSFSPELFFRKEKNHCQVRPMKGTVHRGKTPEEDKRLAGFLGQDPKNRSENIMIVDLLRNDLGRISLPGQVTTPTLFSVENYETVHQMTSTVEANLRPDTSLLEFCRALLPCGSVTGAPKIRTMEIIRELEKQPRGVYTGGIGFFTPSGDATFNVPIRTVVLDEGKGEMGIGSGVVYDSDPEGEWQECRLKGNFLVHPVPKFELIETLLLLPEKGFWLLDYHLQRLYNSAAHLCFSVDKDAVQRELEAVQKEFQQGHKATQGSPARRVRLLLSKSGSFDIQSTPCDPPNTLIFAEFITPKTNQHSPRVVLSGQKVDTSWQYLYHKTTQRELYNNEFKIAQQNGFFEVIFENEKGEITEGSFTNIFIKNGDTLSTPPVASGLLPGVFRQYLFASYPDKIQEAVLTREDIEKADCLYVGNSVRGLVKVEFNL